MCAKWPVRTVAQINQTAVQEDSGTQRNGVHNSTNQRRNMDVLVPSSFAIISQTPSHGREHCLRNCLHRVRLLCLSKLQQR